MGIYAQTQERSLKWLSEFNLYPDSLEQKDLYAPGYAPHLAAYIDALVQFKDKKEWNRLKRIKRLFPNNLVRYLLIRALAYHNHVDELRIAISEYCKQARPANNVELAFYAAKAGMPVSDVTAIAGTIETPKATCPDYVPTNDPIFKHYMYSFIVVAYEENENSYINLCNMVGKDRTLWTSALQHLLKACHCIGQSFRSAEYDWYEEARDSIAVLVHAEQGDGERICESIDVIRKVLPQTISLLTEQIQKRFPKRLGDWVNSLSSLRDSLLWNTHFGISETRQDYNFELDLWEALATIPSVCSWLDVILKNCAETYKKSTMLKGGCRSEHFIQLSSIMAKCRMRDDAEKWLHYGINSSLLYGYHKDTTLLNLIDILKLFNHRQPKMPLEICARILSMAKWMPHLTDNRETDHFTEVAFEVILDTNQRAAFDLIKYLSQTKTTAQWKIQNCLEKYLLQITDGDPEYLWYLTELFSNRTSEDGVYCKQIMETRWHIVDLAHKKCSEEIYRDFEKRFKHFVLTEITPRHWPEYLKKEFNILTDLNDKNNASSPTKVMPEFVLDGKIITKKDIEDKCQTSFSEFLATIEKLKAENDHFYEYDIIKNAVRHHISIAKSAEELVPIKIYAENQDHWQNSNFIENLAERFMEFGDQDNAIACFGLAYACSGNKTKHLALIATKDRQIAKTFLLKKCYESICGFGGGYDAPLIAAMGLDVLDEPRMIETIFNDFLSHCESMFSQLPQNNEYIWLKNYKEPSTDANQLILDLVVEELSTPEIDHGYRLIRAVSRLAIARSKESIPLLIIKIGSASGRTLRRLLTIFYILAAQHSDLLVPYQQELGQLLDREDFFCRQTILHILRYVEKVSPLKASVASSFQNVDRNYSANIYYSSYRMSSSPTSIFSTFLRRNILFDFSGQISFIEKILQVPSGSLVAAIEKRLLSQNWSMNDEQVRIKEDWDGHVHPQDWPVIWITTEFQELITAMLAGVLNEAANKLKLSEEQLHLLWQTIQHADPEYILNGIMSRPSDILPLKICNKQAWLSELEGFESMQIRDRDIITHDEDWITVFEKRRMSQEEKYNVPYKQEISLTAFLIPQWAYGKAERLDELKLTIEQIAPSSVIAVTIHQMQMELKDRGHEISNINSDTIPLIAAHQNPPTFLGYFSLCSLASFIINEYDLSFEGGNLIRNKEVVAKYEAWQEGYQNNPYSREKLSFGVRLRVNRSFLSEICSNYHKILCISINEKRQYYKSIHDRKPDDSQDSKRYIIYYL